MSEPNESSCFILLLWILHWDLGRLRDKTWIYGDRWDATRNIHGDLQERSRLEITGHFHKLHFQLFWLNPTRRDLKGRKKICHWISNVYTEDPSLLSAMCVFQMHMEHLAEGELYWHPHTNYRMPFKTVLIASLCTLLLSRPSRCTPSMSHYVSSPALVLCAQMPCLNPPDHQLDTETSLLNTSYSKQSTLWHVILINVTCQTKRTTPTMTTCRLR